MKSKVGFFQLLFIKYTADNKRIFYPNFFSNGYFITSEEQMIKYREYGNGFFILCFFAFLAIIKFKILKLLIKMHLLTSVNCKIALVVLIILGIIYNLISEKIIFKHALKIQEKFWVNNPETINFLKKVCIETSLYLLGISIFANFLAAYVKNSIAAIIGSICLVTAFFVFINSQLKQVANFTTQMELKALQSFAQCELEKIPNSGIPEFANSFQITENIKKYIPALLYFLITQENLSYESNISNIVKFIKQLKRYNIYLYKCRIEEKEHTGIIEERFLPRFKCG